MGVELGGETSGPDPGQIRARAGFELGKECGQDCVLETAS